MIHYKRFKAGHDEKVAPLLDPTDRSPIGHSFEFERSRWLKDALCIVRERIMSPLLKLKYPESKSMNFSLIAKEWSMSLQRQRQFCSRKLGGLENKTVLVLGCGFGSDALSWLSMGPSKIIGVDIINYAGCWRKAVSTYSTDKNRVNFYQLDLVANDWSFLEPGSVDVIFSYAVLEHLSDLEVVLERAMKFLKSKGMFVASYGPLWYGPNGDHTFPKSEDDIFNHLMLDDDEYRLYVEKTMSEWMHLQNGGEGPFLLERGYFSYLRPGEYLEKFNLAGFKSVVSILNISSAAERYFRKFPQRLNFLKKKFNLNTLDLYSSGSTVILQKP